MADADLVIQTRLSLSTLARCRPCVPGQGDLDLDHGRLVCLREHVGIDEVGIVFRLLPQPALSWRNTCGSQGCTTSPLCQPGWIGDERSDPWQT
ncbi:uncharacterized protein MYCFIDRAFT_210382, partial [Pseudocercospora fijiensis CIRAD86]